MASAVPVGDRQGARFALAVASLWRRELVRFYRQPSRVVGALLSPVVFWLLIGAGLGTSFRHPALATEMNYLEYFFPGTLGLILLFTAIFSTVSVIEDRREGFLQGVLVAPIPRAGIVLAKILGGTTLATVQGLLFLALAPLAGIKLSAASLLLTVPCIVMVSFAMTGLGFVVAWPMDSTQGFHSVMNLLLIPMWLLSGALFPVEGAAAAVRWVMWLNPFRYAIDGLRITMYWGDAAEEQAGATLLLALTVTVLFGLLMFGVGVWVARVRDRGGK